MRVLYKILLSILFLVCSTIAYSINVFPICNIHGIGFSSPYLIPIIVLIIFIIGESSFGVVLKKKKQQIKNISLIKSLFITVLIFIVAVMFVSMISKGFLFIEKLFSVILSGFVAFLTFRLYKLNKSNVRNLSLNFRAILNLIFVFLVGWYLVLLFKDLFLMNLVICENHLPIPDFSSPF